MRIIEEPGHILVNLGKRMLGLRGEVSTGVELVGIYAEAVGGPPAVFWWDEWVV